MTKVKAVSCIKLIHLFRLWKRRENTLWNHILTSLFHKEKTIAEKKGNKYVLWTSTLWTGGFYPIFKIEFNENKEISKIETSSHPR